MMSHLTILFVLMSAGSVGSVWREEPVTARGTFDVKTTPQPQDDPAGGPFGRLFLDKRFHGDLEATSRGQMMAAQTAVAGSGAYVALELVSGTLHGKRGTFILLHRGTMRQGDYVLDVTVVPDSGTAELAGITGAMTIVIKGSDHSYEFMYSLDKKP